MSKNTINKRRKMKSSGINFFMRRFSNVYMYFEIIQGLFLVSMLMCLADILTQKCF